jgi:hypothetical protein
MYRQRLETLRETIQRLARRLAVAVRVIPPARLTVIGATGGTITVTAEGRTLSVRHPERITITLPRGASVHVSARADPRYRFVALRIDSVEITEPEHEFIIMSDTTVTAGVRAQVLAGDGHVGARGAGAAQEEEEPENSCRGEDIHVHHRRVGG